MAGLLDDMFGSGDNAAKDEFGQTRQDRAQPGWDSLIKAGLLAVAGGENLMPNERARYIAAAGGAIGDAGSNAMEQRSQAARQALSSQQIRAGQQELAQKGQWQRLVSSPEFRDALSKLPPAQQAVAIGAAMKGDFGTVEKTLDQRWKTDARGNFLGPNGEIIDQYGKSVIGADGKPVVNTSTGAGPFDAAQPNVGGVDRLNLTALQGVPHEIAVQALRVARGEVAAPTTRSNTNAQKINELAAQIAGANGTSFKTRQDFESSIISGGKTATGVIMPWSKMMQHGAAAQKAYDELAHRDGGKWGALLDKGDLTKAQITDPDVLRLTTEFQTEMSNYVQEAQKLIAGSGALTEGARAEVHGLNNPSKAPAEQIGHMNAFNGMTKPALDQVLADARRVRHDSTITLESLGINPDSIAAHEWLKQRLMSGPGTGKKPAAAAGAPAAGGALPTITSKEAFDKLDPGTHFKDANGKEWTK